ncbi:hypothetical protein KUCAC02_004047, partial [Chaenocephalus aceratus]
EHHQTQIDGLWSLALSEDLWDGCVVDRQPDTVRKFEDICIAGTLQSSLQGFLLQIQSRGVLNRKLRSAPPSFPFSHPPC